MLDLTDFYSPTDAPPGCRVSVSSSAVSIVAGTASFTVRRGELHVRWQTPWTGDEQRWRPVGDVAAVRARPDERTVDGQKSERLELTWRDGETIAPMVRQKAAAVRWVEGRLHDVLGLAPAAPLTTSPAAAVSAAEDGNHLPLLIEHGVVRARSDHLGAVVRLGPGTPYVLLHADAGGLRAWLRGSPADRSFEWPRSALFGVDAEMQSDEYHTGTHKVDLLLTDGRRVRLVRGLGDVDAKALAALLARTLNLPTRRQRAQQFLAVSSDVHRAPPVPHVTGRGPDKPLPLLPYGREGALPILVTCRDGTLTVAQPPAPANAELPRRLVTYIPLLVAILGVTAFIGTRPGVPHVCFLIGGGGAVLLWLLAASSGVGQQVDVTVTPDHFSRRVSSKTGDPTTMRWETDNIRAIRRSSRGIVMETTGTDTSRAMHTLFDGVPAGELDELTTTLRAALGLAPPPRPNAPDAANPPLASATPA